MTNTTNKKYTTSKRGKKDRAPIISAAILFLAIAVMTAVLLLFPKDRLPDNVFIQGIEVSGMSRSDAISILKAKFSYDNSSAGTIFVKYDNQIMKINLSDLKLKYNIEETVDKALAGQKGAQYTLMLTFEDSSFETISDTIRNATYVAPIAEIFTFDENSVTAVITAGKYGREADVDKLEKDLTDMASKAMSGSIDVEFKRLDYETVSYSSIYNAVYVPEVSSKYYRDEATGKVLATESKEGRMISYAEIQNGATAVRKGAVESYTFTIQSIAPSPSQADLMAALFRDVLGSATTEYASDKYAANRASNIALAASFIHEYILMPGDIFSYNGVVGERTPERGFKIANAYEQGEVIEAYGGGICQVSTVIFNAFLNCGKITSMDKNLVSPEDDAMFAIRRYSHMMTVSYEDRGLDATVDYGSDIDFKIRNDTDTPVKIVIKIEKLDTAGNRSKMTVQVMGTKNPANEGITYKYVGIDTSETPMGTEYVEDPSLAADSAPVLKSGGYTGYTTITHRYKLVNGVAEEDYMLYWSTYTMVPEKYRVPVGWVGPNGEIAGKPAA